MHGPLPIVELVMHALSTGRPALLFLIPKVQGLKHMI